MITAACLALAAIINAMAAAVMCDVWRNMARVYAQWGSRGVSRWELARAAIGVAFASWCAVVCGALAIFYATGHTL